MRPRRRRGGAAIPDYIPRDLPGRNPVSETTIHGRSALALGGAVLVFGLILLAALLAEPERALVPFPVALGAVLMFPLAGTVFVIHGARGIARERRMANLCARHPDAPWLWDHRWDRAGASEESRELSRALSTGAAGALFLLAMTWFVVVPMKSTFPTVVVGVLILAALAVLGWGVYLVLRRLKYGRGRLRFTTFPYSLGRELTVDFQAGPRLRDVTTLTAMLRCIKEEYVTRGKSRSVECRQLYADSVTISGGGLSRPGGDRIRLKFPLPEGDYETRLGERPPRYWELEVQAEAPGIDYGAKFLLPVYAAPRTGASGEPVLPAPGAVATGIGRYESRELGSEQTMNAKQMAGAAIGGLVVGLLAGYLVWGLPSRGLEERAQRAAALERELTRAHAVLKRLTEEVKAEREARQRLEQELGTRR